MKNKKKIFSGRRHSKFRFIHSCDYLRSALRTYYLLASNPSQAYGGFMMILQGGFTDGIQGIGQMLYYATPIIMTGLSVGFAFQTGLFNIGAPGQFTVGAYVAILIGVKCTFLPAGLHCFVAIAGAALAGALWGMVPGLLKAFRNVNEVIASIMMNYIGMYMVNMLIQRTIYDQVKNQSMQLHRLLTCRKRDWTRFS